MDYPSQRLKCRRGVESSVLLQKVTTGEVLQALPARVDPQEEAVAAATQKKASKPPQPASFTTTVMQSCRLRKSLQT